MTRPQVTVEAVFRTVVMVAFPVALVGLSVSVGQALHPVAGWLVPSVVCGVALVWSVGRWFDERAAERARAEHAVRARGEPLMIPDGWDEG